MLCYVMSPETANLHQCQNLNQKYTVFQKKFTLLLFTITKSDVDRFQ